MEKYKNMYLNNKDFKDYVDKYCNCLRHKGITVEQALQNVIVQNYADYLIKGGADAGQRV